MRIGANLLSLAMGLVGSQPVPLEKFLKRTTNATGFQEPSYAPAKSIRGNVQPVPRTLYQSLGLDFARKYVRLYTPANVVAVDRDGCGDRITYDGEKFVCESATDWHGQNGWVAVLAVRVPN